MPGKPPLDELIFTILSQHTSDINRDRAWERLRGDHESWASISNLSAPEIEDRIKIGGLAGQKAKRILSILHCILRDHGTVNLDFLEKMSDSEISRYLLSFPGVGPKTVACVMLFSLNRAAFPVDTHVHRLSTRLGLLPKGASSPQAHTFMAAIIPTKMYLTLHLNLISHGRKICRAVTPLCRSCVLGDICPRIT